MIETSIVKACCALIAALMAGANIGFLAAAIFANSKYRDLQAEGTLEELIKEKST